MYSELLFVVIHFLYIVDKSLIAEPGAAGRRILACEIPVALVVRYGLMQSVYGLEHQLNGCLHALGAQNLHYLAAYLLGAERLVHGTHAVMHLADRLLQLGLASLVGILYHIIESALMQQLMLRPLEVISKFNGWDPHLVWQIDREVLTTLDNSKTGVTMG